jgi:hypothetical protein
MERALSSAWSFPETETGTHHQGIKTQEVSRRQWNSNWASDLLISSGRYPPGNREGNGQSYGEGNEESDSDSNGLSNPQGNRRRNGAGNRPSNWLNYLPGCGEGNGQGNGESSSENDPAGNGQGNLDRNSEGCGGDGGGDFHRRALAP